MPYEKDGIKYPRCTNIISDCTSKGDAMTQWAANCAVEYIKNNMCADPSCPYIGDEIFELLEKARFAFKTVSDKALDVGSEVHGLIEEYLKYTLEHRDGWIWPDGMSEEVHNAFKAFWDWSIDHNLKPIELEKTVYGSRWAGTLDFYGYFDDRLYVIDWKTSKPKNKKTGKGIYPEMRYQVAAYREAIHKEIFWKKAIELPNMTILPDEFCPTGCGVLRLDKETGMPDWNDTSATYEQDLRVFNRMVDLYFERHPIIKKRFAYLMPF